MGADSSCLLELSAMLYEVSDQFLFLHQLLLLSWTLTDHLVRVGDSLIINRFESVLL